MLFFCKMHIWNTEIINQQIIKPFYELWRNKRREILFQYMLTKTGDRIKEEMSNDIRTNEKMELWCSVLRKQWPITVTQFTSTALLSRPALLINPTETPACSHDCWGMNYFHKVLCQMTRRCFRLQSRLFLCWLYTFICFYYRHIQ